MTIRLLSIVGALALLLGCALSGCAAGAGDPSGAAGASGAGGSGVSGAGGTTGGAGVGQAGSDQAGRGGGAAGTTGVAGIGPAGAGGDAGASGAGGSSVAGAGGAAGSSAGTGGRGGGAVAGRGGTGGDSGAAGAAGRGGGGGTAGRGGAAGTGAAGAGGGAGGGVMRSAGCGKTPTLLKSTPPPNTRMQYNRITSSGQNRQYLLWYPDNYDNNRPYRLVFAFHWRSGSASQVFDCNTEGIRCYTTQTPFYGHLRIANDTTIFIAPDGLNAGWANSNGQDVTFTDDILTQVSNDLCIDMSRVFANGFSYGAGMSYALACARPNVFRAVGIYAGGMLSGCSGGNSPVAYYATHGLDDGTLQISGGRTMRDRFVRNNGCTAMNPPEPANNSGTHICTSYEGCSAGHPVRWCAFDGSNGHDPSPRDPGQSMTWNPEESWKFFTQF